MASPAPDMHGHTQLTEDQYKRMHGGRQPAYFHNGEPHQHKSGFQPERRLNYGRPLANATWDVPVRLLVEERNGEIVKLTVMPKESFAGYFGPHSTVIEGATVFDGKEGMWDGIADYLAANQVYGSDDRYFLHWES